jgi:glycosyltransferase involved in cell wall biosynthesis
MKVLVVAGTYPHPGHPFSGIFNERSAQALRRVCEAVEVLAPRPYVPPLLSSFVGRWKAYTAMPHYELREEISVYRPAVPVVPRIGGALWLDYGAFIASRLTARKMHLRRKFDAILSFDLLAAGGLAWRVARDLGIPAAGWATGGDVRVALSSSYAKVVRRALQNLDLVFYQSHELLQKGAGLLGVSPVQTLADKHLVLPRGIPQPPNFAAAAVRNRLRKQLGVADDRILVLNVGRIARDKGVFELLDSFSSAAEQDPRISCVLVGSLPAFDETELVQKYLDQNPHLRRRVIILPTCNPAQVWEYLCAADIFAFTSHHEGMPNSLLEAMVMGVPAVAFGIPPVLEIEAGTDSLIVVPPFDPKLFAEAMLRLAASPSERARVGERGKTRIKRQFMMDNNMAAALQRLREIKRESRTELAIDRINPRERDPLERHVQRSAGSNQCAE